jgi:hypothetical protein
MEICVNSEVLRDNTKILKLKNYENDLVGTKITCPKFSFTK